MDPVLPLVVVLSATALSALMVPPSKALARRTGVIDHPGDRKVHEIAMPRLGGVAVFTSFVGIVVLGYALIPSLLDVAWFRQHLGSELGVLSEAYRVQGRLAALLTGGSIIFVTGLADDVLGPRLPVWVKAAGQLLAAGVLVFVGEVQTSFLPQVWMNQAVTLVWLVGITNSFNLLDNMDGLSAGVAAVASGILLLNAWLLDEYFITLIFAAFLGSLLGFLFFNFRPASIFLGDCGSLLIGFVMGSLTLLERYVSHASSTLFPVLMPVVVLAVPIVDTATVVFIRLRERRPIYVGDARHLSHQLVRLGLSQRRSVLFIYLVTLSLGLGAIALVDASPGRSLMILTQVSGFVALILILMFGTNGGRVTA